MPFEAAAVGFVGFFAVVLTAGAVAFGLPVGLVITVGTAASTAAAGVATAGLVGLRGARAGCFFVSVAGTGFGTATTAGLGLDGATRAFAVAAFGFAAFVAIGRTAIASSIAIIGAVGCGASVASTLELV